MARTCAATAAVRDASGVHGEARTARCVIIPAPSHRPRNTSEPAHSHGGSMDNPPAPRNSNGRFAEGNPGGPGGSRRKACELRRATEDAVTPEIASAVMRKVTMQALQGNLAAARIFFER